MAANERASGPRKVFIDGVEIKEVFDVGNEWTPFKAPVVQIKLYGTVTEVPGELRIVTSPPRPRLQTQIPE